jgi:hypothetical protein
VRSVENRQKREMRSREEGGGSIEGEERGKRTKGGDGFGRLTGRVRTELKAPHRSGQVPETCRLYTAETHHTRFLKFSFLIK